MPSLTLDPKTTALVLIDLQHAIVGMNLAPYTGSAIVAKGAALAAAFRQKGAAVVYVRVNITELWRPLVDTPAPAGSPPPAQASELVPEAGFQTGDIFITKRQWGAFHATELDQQLRRRGITTIVLGGIATNFGVESTARAANEHGYQLVLVEDAMTTVSAEAHAFTVKTIFPRLGRIRSSDEVLAALS